MKVDFFALSFPLRFYTLWAGHVLSKFKTNHPLNDCNVADCVEKHFF